VNKRYVMGAVVAAAALPFVGFAGTAHAAPAGSNTATVISHVTINKDNPAVGSVRAQYSCQPGIDHLWVSVKQNATATADTDLLQEGSGFEHVATAWLQSHPTGIQCDGKTHVQTFEITTTEQIPPEFGGGTIGYGELQRGQGYVQFCLTSSANDDLLIADMNFQTVK
jgi:hypothetical protein